MPTFRYEKLVRDNILGFHKESGHTLVVRKLEGTELKQALLHKLHEEADEVPLETEKTDEVIEELADVQQVLDDIKQLYGISDDELSATQCEKRERKGGFLHGDYIESVTMPNEDDKWVKYCRKQPEKYPEVVTE